MQRSIRIPGMRFASAILLSAILSCPSFAQSSALTVPRNIAQLTQQAATIVQGQVLSVRVEPHPQLANLTTVVVTLRVEKSLKGTAASSLTFRQFVWDIRDKQTAAGFRKGQELLLLLNPTSVYGLTSPAGMEQGRFQISRDAKGNITAVNGRGNVGLFANVSAQAKQARVSLSSRAATLITQHRSGPVALSDLEEVITQFAGAPR
jgi:hypothetical protein